MTDPLSENPVAAPLQPCVWQRNADGYEEAACGLEWCLEDGTPPEHGMKFCPSCGHPLEWHDVEPDDEWDGDEDRE